MILHLIIATVEPQTVAPTNSSVKHFEPMRLNEYVLQLASASIKKLSETQ
jgi:hypothetical protein